MCKLPDGVANSDVNDLKERTEQYIDLALQYAYRSWHTHLVSRHTTSVDTLEITCSLHRFLEGMFLFWLEVLSRQEYSRRFASCCRLVGGVSRFCSCDLP